jgi:hypothetical protein
MLNSVLGVVSRLFAFERSHSEPRELAAFKDRHAEMSRSGSDGEDLVLSG